MGPRNGADGKLVFALPMGDRKFPGIAAEDIGRCAYGIFKRGSEFIGRTVGVAGDHLTGAQMAEALGAALGQPVTYYPMPFDDYRKLGFPGAPGQKPSSPCAPVSAAGRGGRFRNAP